MAREPHTMIHLTGRQCFRDLGSQSRVWDSWQRSQVMKKFSRVFDEFSFGVPCYLSSSTSAKIAALEAKLKTMEEGRSSSGPQRPTEGRRRKRIQESRVITRPQKSRTHRFRTRGPLVWMSLFCLNVIRYSATSASNAQTRTCQVSSLEVMETGVVTEGDVVEANGEIEEEQTEAMLQATPAQDFCLESITCCSSY